MRQSELCDIKDCKNKIAEACVWHHCDDVSCNFNPFTDQEDESHCMLKVCNNHAKEYRLVQKGDNMEGLDIKFKDKKHHHNRHSNITI
jgi:hypothetical protein